MRLLFLLAFASALIAQDAKPLVGQLNTVSGDGRTIVTTKGPQISGRCVFIDADGNHVPAGAACGSGAGGGATIASVTNLIAGDGAGNGVDSGIATTNVVVKNAANTWGAFTQTFGAAVAITGNLSKIQNVSLTWPTSNVAGVLTNDGSGGLTYTNLSALKASNLADLANAAIARSNLGLGAAAQLAVSTVIATPGVDTKAATEKAVRDLFATVSGGGTVFTVGPNNTITLVSGVLDTDNAIVGRLDQTTDVLSNWIYHIGQTWIKQSSCDTPAAGNILLCALTSDNAPHYKTSDGIVHDFGSSGGAFHAVKATQSTGQVVPGSFTATPLQFDEHVSITDGSMHSTSSNKANFVIPATGWYAGNCNVVSDSNDDNTFFWITLNGAKITGTQHKDAMSSGYGEVISFDGPMTSGDVVQCVANSGSGFTSSNTGLLVKTSMSLYLVH